MSNNYYQNLNHANTPNYDQYQNQTSYALGESMVKYATANWVFLGGMIILPIVYFIILFAIVFSNNGFMMMIALPIVGIGLGIYKLARMIQYLSKLNETATTLNDSNLKRSYNCQLWSLILTLCGPVIIFILYFAMFSFNSSGYLGIFFLMILLSIGLTLAILILTIVSAVALDHWAEFVIPHSSNQRSFVLQSIKSGTENIKLGQILFAVSGPASFTGIGAFLILIGPIFTNIGFSKAGRNIMLYFGDTDPQQFHNQPHSITPPSHQASTPFSSQNHNPVQSTYRPSDSPIKMNDGSKNMPPATTSRMCLACGVPILVDDATFCATCGRKLH